MLLNLSIVLQLLVSTSTPQGCLTGVLGHWAFGPLWSQLLCTGQRKRELLCPALPHFLSQSNSTCSVPQKSFQVLFETGKRRRGRRNQSLYSSRRSIAWHYPPAIPLTPLSRSLLCSQCVSLNLFFLFPLFPSLRLTFFFFFFWHFIAVTTT